jgi:FKBP-type peptidyl-prolyl cis-trans isomerase SlyD
LTQTALWGKCGVASDQPFQVGPDTVAHFSYQLFDEEGELVEDSGGQEFSFLFGYGQLVPRLEMALEGMLPGARKRVQLGPKEAFGERDLSKIIEVDPTDFPPDVAPGDEFVAENEEGDGVTLVVLDVDAERVVLDANHPLAGQTVVLELRVAAVRPALAAEIAEAAQLLERGQTAATSLLPAARLLRRPSTTSSQASQRPEAALEDTESVAPSEPEHPSSDS